MPLHVTDFTWTQTDSEVHISVPLKGAKTGSVDVVSTDEYLKVNFPPHLFEAFFFQPVNDERSSAKIGNGVAVFTLPKRTPRIWERLMLNTDKETKRTIRDRALTAQQQKLSAESKQRAEKQQADRKYTLETMMKLQNQERDRIQRMKEAERDRTTAELAAWQNHLNRARASATRPEPGPSEPEHTEPGPSEPEHTEPGPTEPGRNQLVRRDAEKKNSAEVPPPRPGRTIRVTFTPREFPTPLRESQVKEEEEWLRKQAEASRALESDLNELKDLREEERNPEWLKDRGDKCFLSGDHLGALNAYSLALRINRKSPALLSNRAAVHLKLKHLHRAIEDSSQALDLLSPAVHANAAARLRASVRRGTAFCQLQLYAEGLQDYEAALKINPHNKELQEDAQKIRDIIQGSATGQRQDA
ncbi:dynein axonemal assembly factor 4 [Austrofundulus limnaeus]|uniref:Dynein axonemal assembly factor 4 n=1 Tax=Austrofundulus limnaeus TaxID=52670 RepID=A0A2I4CEL2_AUSLI|nr:PREDICTED: dyslexia susceptibility 1 candidate gene 1 protein [Austrofundulus limnaeus]